jgi:hypothetical protein
VLTLGDNQYPYGQLADFNAYYDPDWGTFRDNTKPSLGNHEQYLATGSQGYWDYFANVQTGERYKGWYSFDLGAWHIVALNSGCASSGSDANSPSCAAGSEQVNWLSNDLAASPADCKLVYWHHPRYSSGTVHGSNPIVHELFREAYEGGADVVLNGHEHHFEQFAKIAPNPDAANVNPVLDPAGGLREFVVGTGGAGGNYPFGTPKTGSEIRGGPNEFGVLRMKLEDGGYSWSFENDALGGDIVASGSDTCTNDRARTGPGG